VCPICQGLRGYTWRFSAKEGVPDILTHPTFGVVWIVGIGSQAHGHAPFGCRCTFHVDVNTKDLKEKIDLLKQAVEQNLRFEVFTRYGKSVGTFRDVTTGRFARAP
jgi:hypothetical protein